MRFSLLPGRYYAMELFSPEFGEQVRHASPIRVYELTAAGGGDRRFELSFHHEAYPQGVRDKLYTVETIERIEHYLFGRVVGTDRLVLFTNLNMEWLHRHFDDRAVKEFLERNKLKQDFS